MAGWISSKLKAAETILQQIDNQAAESLGKSERPQSDELNSGTPIRSESVPLKDQLKKKTSESRDIHGKSRRNSNVKIADTRDKDEEVSTSQKPSSNRRPSLTDGDWTELLGMPNQPMPPRTNGKSTIPRKKGSEKGLSNASKLTRRSEMALAHTLNGGSLDRKPSDGEESGPSDSSQRTSSVELKLGGGPFTTESKDGASAPNNDTKLLVSGIVDKEKEQGRSISSVLRTGSFSRIGDRSDSDSETDSGSTSGSESEGEREERRKRREQILAEKAAAKAAEAIKERENLVARLEGEKQSLEKILEERAKQQAQEASELQTSMMETMEAVDLEKQKHNSTRMEALARLAKLETANADLARCLATAQWNLEVEANRVGELRQQVESKEVAHGELRRRISKARSTGTSSNQLIASKGVEFEREILEAEYSLVTDKIAQLQEKAMKLETNIEMTRKYMEDPTEVEVELKRRLSQLTDHLIQKQAQVETLASERAMLLFRIEAVSKLLEENAADFTSNPGRSDLESGIWEFSNSKLRPMFEDKIRTGKKQLGSFLWQLDAIFSAGIVFLKRNPKAKYWCLAWLVCLHLWVFYILTSHSKVSEGSHAGAVVSLENIDNTSGV